MTRAHIQSPRHPNSDVPEEFEPGLPPVEPDEGPVPALIPGDTEHERDVDRGAIRTRWPARQSSQEVVG